MDECAWGATAVIAPLYQQLNLNPERRDCDEVYAECHVRHGVAPEGFTGEDCAEWLSSGNCSTPLGHPEGSEEAELMNADGFNPSY